VLIMRSAHRLDRTEDLCDQRLQLNPPWP